MNIVGTICNATIFDSMYYIIFTEDKVLQFNTIERRDLELKEYLSNTPGLAPLSVGAFPFNSYMPQPDSEYVISENMLKGEEIKKNIDELIKEKSKFKEIPYSSIKYIKLVYGGKLRLPKLIICMNDKKVKFCLIHSGSGKYDEILLKYKNMLNQLFKDKFVIKE